MKGRRQPGEHVFRASRFSRGNFLFPTQVIVTPGSVLHYTPEIVGGREQSIHVHHIASVLIDRNLFFSDVLIETSGGASPVRCHGHRKRDAVAMKQLIERFQSDYYRRPSAEAARAPAHGHEPRAHPRTPPTTRSRASRPSCSRRCAPACSASCASQAGRASTSRR